MIVVVEGVLEAAVIAATAVAKAAGVVITAIITHPYLHIMVRLRPSLYVLPRVNALHHFDGRGRESVHTDIGLFVIHQESGRGAEVDDSWETMNEKGEQLVKIIKQNRVNVTRYKMRTGGWRR